MSEFETQSGTSSEVKTGPIARLAQAPWVEPFLGALVAVYGILTAYAAYNAGIYGGNSSTNYFVAIADLSEANYFYAQGNADYSFDSAALIQLRIQEQNNASQSVLDAITNEMSDLALESLDRSQELDEEYLDETFYLGGVFAENSDAAFVAAQEWNSIADKYEFLVLMLAVGLGFGAWAALMKPDGPTRYIFGSLATLLLVVNVTDSIMVLQQELPEMIPTCWEQTTSPCSEALADEEENDLGEGSAEETEATEETEGEPTPE